MGWFGRKAKMPVEDVGVALYWSAIEELTRSLAHRGYDLVALDREMSTQVAPHESQRQRNRY